MTDLRRCGAAERQQNKKGIQARDGPLCSFPSLRVRCGQGESEQVPRGDSRTIRGV